jgi:hypothetical protein
VPRDIRVQLPRTVAQFEPKAAAAVLMRHLGEDGDGAARFKMLRALVKLRRLRPDLSLDPTTLLRIAEATLEHAEELKRWGIALASGDDDASLSMRVGGDPLRAAHHLLVDLVRDKQVHSTERLFLLLELMSRDKFDDIWRGLKSRSAKARASSLELLENLVKPPLRGRVLAIVADIGLVSTAGRASVAPPSPVAKALTYEGAIREILAHHSGTMRTLAEYRAAELGIDTSGIGTPARTPEESFLSPTFGERLLGTARDLLTPPLEGEGGRGAPA